MISKPKCLIQLGTGSHEALLDAVKDHHQWYCQLHGIKYLPKKESADKSLPPSWSRIPLLIEALEDYRTAVWMDTDAVVCDPFFDITSACRFGVGAARYDSPFTHYQTGVLVCHSSPEVIDFLKQVLEAGRKNDYTSPGRYGAWEQHPINEIGIERGIICSISTKWNLVPPHAFHESPVVMAAHGHPMDQREALVRKWSEYWKKRRFLWQ